MNNLAAPSDFPQLLADLKAGDAVAARRVFDQYGPVIRAAVRRKLHARLRARFDSLDFVQDVWASVLAIPSDQYQFETPAALVSFLSQVANNKVVEVFRQRFQTDKHAITREVGLSSSTTDDAPELEPPARVSTPSQYAIADEVWQNLLTRIPERHRPILERLRSGYSLDQIAAETKVSVSTVHRVVRRLKDLSGI